MTVRMRMSAVVIGAMALLLAGCSSPPPQSTGDTVAQLPLPAGVHDPAIIPSSAPTQGPQCNPKASLRPSGPLPSPGEMPAGSYMAKIRSAGRLVVGVDQNTFLFGYRNAATGEIEGFDIDIAREVAAAIFGTADGHIQLVAITAAQRIPFVQQGKVDLVADTMTMNCERWKQVSFSSQYYAAGQKVLVPVSSKATKIQDLGGQKVCAAEGSTSIVNIANVGDPKNPATRPIPVSVANWTDCLVLLQQNQVAAISTDDTILLGLKRQDPTTKLVGGFFSDEPYGMAIASGHPEFVRFVNGVLENVRPKRWFEIYQKWLGKPEQGHPPAAEYQD